MLLKNISKCLCLNYFTVQRLIGLRYMDRAFLHDVWHTIERFTDGLEISSISNRDAHFKCSSAIGRQKHKCNQQSSIEALTELRRYIAIEHDIDLNRLKVEMSD